MALCMTESFDWSTETAYPTTSDLCLKHNRVFSGNTGFVGSYGGFPRLAYGSGGPHGNFMQFGGGTFAQGGSSDNVFCSVLDPFMEDDLLIVGFRFYPQGGGGTNKTTFMIGERRILSGSLIGSTDFQMEYQGSPANTFQMKTADGTNLFTWTPTLNVWYYLEFKVRVHASAGTVVVKINGLTVVNASGLNTRQTVTGTTGLANYCQWMGAQHDDFNGGQAANIFRIDDMYILNEQGSANTDFLGDCIVSPIAVNGAGSNTGLTPSAALPNWDIANDAGSSNWTDWNESAVVDTYDLYACSDITVPQFYVVKGVEAYAIANKPDTGARGAAIMARGGGVNVQGGDFAIPYTGDSVNKWYGRLPMDKCPDGTDWNQTNVNSVEIGIKVRP